jgi:hypothetical protein
VAGKGKAKPAASTDPAEQAILESIRRARQVFASGSGTTLAILKDADQKLSEQLHKLLAKNGGPKETFTESSAVVYRKQVQLVTQYLEHRINGQTDAQARKAIKVALQDTVAVAKALEKKFTGLTRPLALDAQQMQDEVVRGTGASLLRRHQTSTARYGQAMVAEFERVMRSSALQGLTQEQVVSRMVEAGKHGGHSARSLHSKEPGYFPEPTSYIKKRYWAERIVRTETAYAHNAGSLQALNITRNTEFPDLMKKIVAVFDARTAPDSVAVHGQIRKLEEMFVDGAGRHYLHPPARPNDRETIIPWRPHWENTPASAPAPPAVQAEATVAAQPSPLGEKRKVDLKQALATAKAKVLGQKAQAEAEKAQAQGLALAKAKAQAAQQAGQQALSHAALVDAAALKAAAEKVTQVVVPGAAFSAAKAKAQEYLKQKEALAKAKAEARAAERAAKLKADAQKYVGIYQDTALFPTAKDLTTAMKTMAKENPRLFAEIWSAATGKPASAVIPKLSKPMTLGQSVLQAAKKIAPDLDYPKPKSKVKPLDPAQKADQFKAEIVATPNLKKAIEIAQKMTGPEIHALLEKHAPFLSAAEIAEIAVKGKHNAVAPAVQYWDKAVKEAAALTVQIEPVGDVTYMNVFDGGKKVAYFTKEGDTFHVKPPPDLGIQGGTFKDESHAKAYAFQVGKTVAAEKAKQAAPKPFAALAAKPPAAKPTSGAAAPAAAVAPGQMHWSSKFRQPERRAAELRLDPASDLAKNLKADLSGHSLALDGDFIENFDVSVAIERVGANTETVFRFKVTAHREAEVLEKMQAAGAKSVEYGYRRLKPTADQSLLFDDRIAQSAPAVTAIGTKKAGVSVSMLRDDVQYRGNLAAGHNVVEIRIKGTEPGRSFEVAKREIEALGISATRPTQADLQAYKRTKILAYVDSDAARDLRALKKRDPKQIEKVWERAVQRNPKLAAVEADAELREVAPGKHALYSPTVAKMFEDAGVRWLSHKTSAPADVVAKILADQKSGLLASRERYQRGMFVEGMSTQEDFKTGGADSAFTRLQTSTGAHGGYGYTFEIDPSETGRLDAYFFNEDNYGKANAPGERKTVDQITDLVRRNQLSGSNELMLQRQVSGGSLRRVVANDDKSRADLLNRLRAAKIEEFNGVPIEEFVAIERRAY